MTDNELLSRRTYLRGVGLTGSASVLTVAGCLGGDDGDDTASGNGGNGANGGTVEGNLEVMHWWTAAGEEDAINALYDGFTEEYPDVEIDDNPAPGGAGNALDTEIRNRIVNENPPGTFQIWPGEALQPFYESDVLEDLSDIWTEEVEGAYLEGVREAASPEGTYVSVPINIHRLNQLFYNVEVVEEAGVNPEDVDSMDALTDALDQVESETDAVGMATSTQETWVQLQFFEMVLLSEIGADSQMEFMDGDVEGYEDEVRGALETTANLREYYNEDVSAVTWDQANENVITGDAAFLHNGDWAAGQYIAADQIGAYGEGWDYVPFPGTGEVYSSVMDSFVYPSNNPSPEATEAWLTYCTTTDAQIRFNREKGSIPPRTDVDAAELENEFLASQMEDFDASSAQPPTIAHGSGVTPDQKSAIESVFADFVETWDVDSAYQGLVDAF